MGLTSLITSGSVLFNALWFWVPIYGTYLIVCDLRHQWIIAVGAWLYTIAIIGTPIAPQSVTGYFSPSSVTMARPLFQPRVRYEGTLSVHGRSIPCVITHPVADRPKADCDWIVEGRLERFDSSYRLKMDQCYRLTTHTKWLGPEWRFVMQQNAAAFTSQHIRSPAVAAFINALTIGHRTDPLLQYQFGKLGLQHVLAISGFHFGVLILCCTSGLRWLIQKKGRQVALMGCIVLYYLFLGSSPSITRSFIMALLFLWGEYRALPTSPLNLLGAALITEWLFDPTVVANVGFQLSYSATAAILFFVPWLHNRPYALTDYRHLNVALIYVRKAILLNAAVNISIAVLLLFHFHTFPCLSIFYNLFIPTLVGLLIMLWLIAIVVHLFIGPYLFGLVNALGTQILELVAYPPLPLDRQIVVESLPVWVAFSVLFGLLVIGIHTQQKKC
ncbi:MAG: hypothetical protein RL235_217 [Chlamydiota bacterium]